MLRCPEHDPRVKRTPRATRLRAWENCCRCCCRRWIPSAAASEQIDSSQPRLPLLPPLPPPPYSPNPEPPPVSSCRAPRGRVSERLATSWPVTVIWGLLSVAVATASLVSLVQPTWFVKEEQRNRRQVEVFMFGAFTFCYRVDYLDDFRCHLYGGLFDFRRYPSGAWHAACLLYSSGCILLSCCALSTVFVALVPTPRWRRHVALVIGLTQAGSVFLLLVALLVFPVGLGSWFVRHVCGTEAAVYAAGDCQMGWGYALALVAAVVAVYCPILAFFTSYKVYKPQWRRKTSGHRTRKYVGYHSSSIVLQKGSQGMKGGYTYSFRNSPKYKDLEF